LQDSGFQRALYSSKAWPFCSIVPKTLFKKREADRGVNTRLGPRGGSRAHLSLLARASTTPTSCHNARHSFRSSARKSVEGSVCS
jgi:hypothetical protein